MGHNTWITRTCLSSLTFWTLLYKSKGEQCKFVHFLLLPSYLQAKQVQDHQHEHSNCEMDKPGDEGGFPGQGISQKDDRWICTGRGSLPQVFCSDILDAITKDFFARKQHTPDETMHVEDIQVLQ